MSAEALHPPLPPALAIGHYVVRSFIGAGGMGEVYRATDRKLGREVALKILPAAFGGEPERVRRFELEAHTTGQLNHPNIVSIYDAGEFEGRPYLVTELLEGETLRSHLSNGPLSIRNVVEFGIQLARGLAAAHAKGIVHRDLKPANIFVLADGHVKILDFGLAKLTQGEWDATTPDGDTISGLSVPGRILGSVGYMAPEQVEARPVDARSDIFAFGAILYEMLTGRRAFSGGSTVATLSAVLRENPFAAAPLRPDAPLALVTIIRRCLEKSPEGRFQTARDLAFALEELGTRSDVSFSSTAKAIARDLASRIEPSRAAGYGLVAAVVIVLAVMIASGGRTGVAVPTPALAPRVPELTRITSSGLANWLVGYSPDQKYIVFSEGHDDGARLMLLHVPTASRSELHRAGYFSAARFSGDGNFIFFSGEDGDTTSLYRIPLLGGQPLRVAAGITGPFALRRNGAEVAYLRMLHEEEATALLISSVDGTNERVAAKTPWTGVNIGECEWAPDDSRMLCSAYNREAMVEVDVITGEYRVAPELPKLFSVQWAPDGKSLFGTTSYVSGLQIVKIDLSTHEMTPITSDLGGYGALSLSPDGRSLAGIRVDSRINLWRVSPENPDAIRQITTAVNSQDGNYGLTVMPDGRIVWASNSGEKSIDLWISQPDGSSPRRLTMQEDSDEKWPEPSPDGRYVVYRRDSSPQPDVNVMDVWRVEVETGRIEQLTRSGDVLAPRYTADGQFIVFARRIDRAELAFIMPADGGEPRQLDERPATTPAVSPDGQWLLVTTTSGKGSEIQLWPFQREGKARGLGTTGRMKKWRPDGKAYAFLPRGDAPLNVHEIDGGKPRAVTSFAPNERVMAFAWTPDSRELIVSRRTDASDVVIIRGLP
jgi:eukaryotic-like serine/threonine-protein kinase